ncbi:ribosomal L18p/L5e family protein [Actinidia rufa]|uniref:Large ribosomal subunit protein uL18c n=1 Tax=Actinidia rufa TaxID=165716 RepID=A0A7J0E5R5_9ERIC|nr:ribosomal L18p/L5e family protein [Actinidia rufa]
MQDNAKEYDIEALTGHESEYIEMDLMLGVADLHTPEAVAAAESAIAGCQPVISLADSSSETESEDSSDDSSHDSSDSDTDGDDDGDHLMCPPTELKRSKPLDDDSSTEPSRNKGTTERPRLCVFRSNKHLYVQVIDDSKMHTLASASTMQKPISEEFDFSSGPTIDVAKKIGEVIAKACLEKGITKVAFDRGGYSYHGRVQALADEARENGLQF